MKKITMFYLQSCPYCIQAFKWMDEIKAENPAYSDTEIALIEESRQPDIANAYDYYYVPTYYVDGRKVHEGAATKEKIADVFEQAR